MSDKEIWSIIQRLVLIPHHNNTIIVFFEFCYFETHHPYLTFDSISYHSRSQFLTNGYPYSTVFQESRSIIHSKRRIGNKFLCLDNLLEFFIFCNAKLLLHTCNKKITRRWLLCRQNLSALGTTSSQNFPSANRFHSCSETVDLLVFSFARLISSFHMSHLHF